MSVNKVKCGIKANCDFPIPVLLVDQEFDQFKVGFGLANMNNGVRHVLYSVKNIGKEL